jgi:hypothetical protein
MTRIRQHPRAAGRRQRGKTGGPISSDHLVDVRPENRDGFLQALSSGSHSRQTRQHGQPIETDRHSLRHNVLSELE